MNPAPSGAISQLLPVPAVPDRPVPASHTGEDEEDSPHHPLGHSGLSMLLGAVIALGSVLLPVLGVLADRLPMERSPAVRGTSPPPKLTSDGSPPARRLPGSGAAQPGR